MMEKTDATEVETFTSSSPPTEEHGSPRHWRDKLASVVYRKKFIYTMCLLFGNFMSARVIQFNPHPVLWGGWINGQRGPSLLDLQLITGTDLSRGSAFFTAAAAGSVLGAVAGGAIYDRFNKYMSLFISMAGHGITVAVIPLCSQYWLMITVFVAHEFFLGIFKTGSNVELIRVWGIESKPYMQALHFLWSLGGIISPFVLEPFLAVKTDDTYIVGSLSNMTNITTGITASNITINQTLTSISPSVEMDRTPETSVQVQSKIIWPFLMTGILTVLSSVPFLVVFIFARSEKHKDIKKVLSSKREGKVLSLKLLILTLGLLGIFYFFLDEVEDSSVAFLATYVVKQLNWSKIGGARITSTFWGSYASGRLAAIFFISYVSHVKICGIFFFLLVLSQIAMILAGYFLSNVGIWITACCVGFSISITFPAMLTWIEKDFVQLSGKIMSVIFIAVGFGGMINPLIIGPLMESFSPLWYNYVLTIESVLLFLSFLMLVFLVKKILNKYHRSYIDDTEGEVMREKYTQNTEDDSAKIPL